MVLWHYLWNERTLCGFEWPPTGMKDHAVTEDPDKLTCGLCAARILEMLIPLPKGRPN